MKKFLKLANAPEWLLTLGESGYGYQIVKARVDEADIREGPLIIVNSLLVVPLARGQSRSGEWLTLDDLIEHEELVSDHLAEATVEQDAVLQSLIGENLLPVEEFHTLLLARMATSSQAAASAIPSPPPPGSTLTLTRRTGPHEGFIRYCHLPIDPRISTAGVVRAGTYTTPWRDGAAVNSGFAAVGRYALPVPLPASYVRVLVPVKNTRVRIGAAVPLFGQAGGGVEAFFPNKFNHQSNDPFQLPPF